MLRAASGAICSGNQCLIPNIDTDFPGFSLKIVEHSCYLLSASEYQAVDSFLRGIRSCMYGTLAISSCLLLGMVLLTQVLLINYSDRKSLEFFKRSKHYPLFWKIFSRSTRASATLALVAILSLVFDRDSSPCRLLLCLSASMGVLALVRLARCLWAVENMVEILTRVVQE